MEDTIMKLAKITLIAILFGLMTAQSAFAQHAHGHGGYGRGGYGHGGGPRVGFGFYLGGPAAFWPGYYPAPYYYPPYYYPPVVTVPASPPVYVEQNVEQSQSTPSGQPEGYWYYCAAAKAYYPYVQQCAGGWQPVSPQPPPPS
jgi:hypothetical protein